MLSVLTWKWGNLFGPEYVNRLRGALERHLRVEHEVVLVTDDPRGVDPRVRVVPLSPRHAKTPRCRRRMEGYGKDFARAHGLRRVLSVDLDVVVTGDITHLVRREDPLVVAPAGYVPVFCGALILHDAGYLDGAWKAFDAEPEAFPKIADPNARVPSDQAMLNYWVKSRNVRHARWSTRDGVVLYFGDGPRYAQHRHLGVGLSGPLPKRSRIVLFGSADKGDLDAARVEWARPYWNELPA